MLTEEMDKKSDSEKNPSVLSKPSLIPWVLWKELKRKVQKGTKEKKKKKNKPPTRLEPEELGEEMEQGWYGCVVVCSSCRDRQHSLGA